MFPVTNDRRSLEDQDPESQVSKFIQNSFVGNKLDEKNFKSYFDQLVNLHQLNKSLRPSGDFLNWLAEEVESRKENKKETIIHKKTKTLMSTCCEHVMKYLAIQWD